MATNYTYNPATPPTPPSQPQAPTPPPPSPFGVYGYPMGGSSGGSSSGIGEGVGTGSSSLSASFGDGSGGFKPGGGFQSESDFPDWLQNHDIHELENEYKGIDQYFNLQGKIKPIRNEANAQYSNALQQGAGAADEQIARAFQTGIVGPINTSLISAQTAMPALQAKLGAEKDIATLRINNMYKEQQARASLANQIAEQRQSYVNTMAQYALGEDRLGLDSDLGHGKLNLEQQQLNFAQRQYNDKKTADAGPTYGELANVMAGYNGTSLGSPSALNQWQHFGAGLGEYADSPVKVSFGGAVGSGGGGGTTTRSAYGSGNPYMPAASYAPGY